MYFFLFTITTNIRSSLSLKRKTSRKKKTLIKDKYGCRQAVNHPANQSPVAGPGENHLGQSEMGTSSLRPMTGRGGRGLALYLHPLFATSKKKMCIFIVRRGEKLY